MGDRLAALRVSNPQPLPNRPHHRRCNPTCHLSNGCSSSAGSAARRKWVRFLPIFRKRETRVDQRRSTHLDSSSSQRTNPYTQFDDRNYEMGDVRSTTNLTSGLSGGAQESMSDFYDEVTPLSMSSARYHGLPTPAGPTHTIRLH